MANMACPPVPLTGWRCIMCRQNVVQPLPIYLSYMAQRSTQSAGMAVLRGIGRMSSLAHARGAAAACTHRRYPHRRRDPTRRPWQWRHNARHAHQEEQHICKQLLLPATATARSGLPATATARGRPPRLPAGRYLRIPRSARSRGGHAGFRGPSPPPQTMAGTRGDSRRASLDSLKVFNKKETSQGNWCAWWRQAPAGLHGRRPIRRTSMAAAAVRAPLPPPPWR